MVGWVVDRVCSWPWAFDLFRTFVFWTHGFTTLDDGALCVRSGYTSTTAVSHLHYCSITHGASVDRFVGVTAVLRTAVLLYVVQGCGWVDRFVPVVCPHGFVGYFYFCYSSEASF